MSSVYNWQRFWCSRGSNVNFEHGYLQDPDGKYGEIYNPNAKRIEAFAQYPCLILLGEPGLGKTFEVAKHRALISAVGRTDVKSLIIDLSSYDNLERLDRKIFQSDEIKLWLADENSNLYLTLESFDECLIRIDALTSFLIEEFEKVPCKRLFLRIVCRTGYWPGPLESGLVKLYKEDNIRFIELMPLRRRDVEQAVKDENISIESFMKDIDAIAITPFAARPITLKFLVNQFKSTGELPGSQEEAYRYGTLKLCDETNPLRIRTVTAGTLPAKKRLVIAERIAAIMIFSNNSRLCTLPDDGNIPDGAISIDKIYGSEEIEGVNFFIDRNAILETLATGLFSSRGENQVGWSHQTYGEFLAASYLIHNSVDKKRIMNLISVLGCRINPQLYSVAAWLALMKREIFEIIRKSEPEILLLGDITTTTEEQKENLCRDYLLKIAETNVIERRLWENVRYDRLNHEKLASQLEIYIRNKAANDNVRREAMFIAEECRVQNLSPILLNIALDVEETLNIRSMAAFVIARVGGSSDRAKLKPLIYDDPQDSVDQIRGYALEAVWPEYLSAEELFRILAPPKKPNYFGGYAAFIREKLVPGLKPSDLPVALNWIIGQPDEKGYLPSRFDELFDKILLFSWENIEQAGVLDLFAKIVLKRINKYKSIIGNEYTDDPFVFKEKDLDRRRSLVEKIVSMVDGGDDICYKIVMSKPPLVCNDDIEWLLGKITKNEKEGQKELWAFLLLIIWRKMGTPHYLITPIYELYKSDKSIRPVFAKYFEAVELTSNEARNMKKEYDLIQKNERRMQVEKKTKLDKPALIKEEIICLEQGEINAWWRFVYFLSLTDDGDHIEDKIDIKKLTGWEYINIEDEAGIADFAANYLLKKNPEMMTVGNSISNANNAAFKAFCYLQSYDYNKYEALPISVWKKWAKLIVCYPIWIDRDNLMIHQELVKKLYTKSPQITLNYLGKYINVANCNERDIDFLDKFDLCWDDTLYDFLLIKIKCEGTKEKTLSKILSKLIESNHEESMQYARELIYGHHKDKALVAAQALLFFASNIEWPFIWEKINSDTDFGKNLMLRAASSYEYTKMLFPNNLLEFQLSELYIWLSMHFPHHEDPQHDGVFSATARDQMVHLRDGILDLLVNRGNTQSCEAVELIKKELPQLDWLATSFERARKIYAEKSWVPPSPQNIIELVKNHNKRLVENGEHLLEVVIEGLQRIQTKLQGETPLAPFLWDQVVKKPKYENDISDFIVSQLRDELSNRGIIINREVEIRSGRSGEEGERTDIHIDAISSFNSHDVVSVIIEVKGCWNRELLTAMESQLVGKYLKDNVCRYGIYLVGWFNCPQWNEKDWRRKDAFQHDLEDIKREFDSQARHLSKSGIEVKAYVIDASLRHSL